MLIRNVRLRLGRVLGAASALLALAALSGSAVTFLIQERKNTRLKIELKRARQALRAAQKTKTLPSNSQNSVLPASSFVPSPKKQSKKSLAAPEDRRHFLRLLEYKRRLASGEPRGKILFEMAKLYHSLGAVEEALKRFEECSDNDEPISGRSEYYLELGRAHSGLGQFEEARDNFLEARDLTPKDPSFTRASASLSLKSGDIDGALKNIDEALRADPEDPLTHHVRGVIQQCQGQFAAAEASYKKALSLLKTKEFDKERDLRLDLAELYGIQGRFSKCERTLKLILGNDPEDSRALFLHGRLDLATGETKSAELYFKNALRAEEKWHHRLFELEKLGLADPYPYQAAKSSLLFQKRSHRARLNAYLALIEARSNRLDTAKTLAAKALKFYSRQPMALPLLKRPALSSREVHKVLLEDHGLYFNQPSTAYFFNQATTLVEQGQESNSPETFKAALAALKIVQWRIPTHGLAKTKEAISKAHLGHLSDALDSARIAPFLTPNQADAFELQARLLSHQFRPATNNQSIVKDRSKALNSLQSMRDCCDGPWVDARAHTLEAKIHLDSKNYGKALKALESARLSYPEEQSPSACRKLAAILELQGKIYKAMGDVESTRRTQDQILKLNIKRAKLRETHYEAGQTLFAKRKYNDAIKEYKVAVEYSPFRGQVHYDLGRAYMKIGNFIPGVLSIMSAVEHDPHLAHKIAMTLRPGGYVVDPQRIIDELNKLVSAYPKRSKVYVLRAYFYCYFATHYPNEKLALNPIATGLSDCNQALKYNPKFHFARLLRADLLSFSGRFDEASSDYKQALAALPSWDTALSSQAIHYFRMAARASASEAKHYEKMALKNLARCVELRFTSFQHRRDPIMKIVRENAEYKALVKGLGK